MNWFQNDALFTQECRKGHKWEKYVAAFLKLQGLEVELKEQTIREHVRDAPQYKPSSDLLCEGVLMEIKSRGIIFHTPGDFPYETIFVDTENGWVAKNPRPKAIICISQKTGAMMWLPSSTESQWKKTTRTDHVREIEDTFYEAERKLWKPIHILCQTLKEKRRKSQ